MADPIAVAQVKAQQEEAAQIYFNSAQFRDSFQNFSLALGVGTSNALSYSTYGFNPITRNRTLLEWIHRGSWLGGVAIDLVADDMTKGGIEITSTMPPDDSEQLEKTAVRLGIWASINDVIKWARLYGGALGVMLVEGQDVSTPLKIDTVGKDDFRGLLVLDRWMVEPSLNQDSLVKELGPDLGSPAYYHVLGLAPALTGQRVHYTRVLRMEGVRLPYAQRVMENLWSISVLERLYDRMIGFDSATQGLSQSIYKSYLRWFKIKGFKQMVSAGGEILQSVAAYTDMMRKFQGIEGLTILDEEDDFGSVNQTNFTGMAEGLLQLGQQLAGALQIPLVRLFGMSPAGLNSTGESDLRMYYDGINQQQERHLRIPVTKIYRMMARSEGIEIPENFNFIFKPLWQLMAEQKAQIAQQNTQAVSMALSDGIIDLAIAAKELRQSSRQTGVFSNISDEYIEELKAAPPPAPPGLEGLGPEGGMPGEEGLQQLGGPFSGASPQGVGAEPEPLDGGDRQEQHRLRLVGRDAAGAHLVPIDGLEIVIETPRGAPRYPHQTAMPADYGYLRHTGGTDGDEVDCFVGPERDSKSVWIISQVHPDTGVVDEDKVMLGYPSRLLALRDYQRSFDDGSGAARIGGVRSMTIERLKTWLAARPKKAA